MLKGGGGGGGVNMYNGGKEGGGEIGEGNQKKNIVWEGGFGKNCKSVWEGQH